MLECWGGMIQKGAENHDDWFDSDQRAKLQVAAPQFDTRRSESVG
jgi:hypothetical protein